MAFSAEQKDDNHGAFLSIMSSERAAVVTMRHPHEIWIEQYEAAQGIRHTRRREKIMGRFKSPCQAQRFSSVHDQTASILRPKRHRLSAQSYRHTRSDAFAFWADYVIELTA